jgi:hypothetical protein
MIQDSRIDYAYVAQASPLPEFLIIITSTSLWCGIHSAARWRGAIARMSSRVWATCRRLGGGVAG